jgi:protein associated with RNAse G/E
MDIIKNTEFPETDMTRLDEANWHFTELIISGKIERDMKLKEFLRCIEFDMDRYAPLNFWFNLNQVSNDEFFVLTEELIDLIGFSKNGSKEKLRTNVLKFIRKNFEEHVDYKEEVHGSFHKIQIKMKKRPFKLLLMKVGTSTSQLVHEYLVDFEEHCMEYMMYQNTCKQLTIKEQEQQIREAPLIYELDDMIDENKVVKFSDVDELHRHTNAYLYRTTDMDNLHELAQTMRYPNAMRCNDKMELIRCIMKEL